MDIRRPAVRAEDDYTYTDKSSGRQLSFTPKPDEAMVTFQGSPSESDVNEVIRTTPLLSVSQGFNLERGFAAVHVSPDQDMEAAMREVKERPATANSLPVMIDQDGLTRYFLPDEFTVQFREGVSKEQAEEIISVGYSGSRWLSAEADRRTNSATISVAQLTSPDPQLVSTIQVAETPMDAFQVVKERYEKEGSTTSVR